MSWITWGSWQPLSTGWRLKIELITAEETQSYEKILAEMKRI